VPSEAELAKLPIEDAGRTFKDSPATKQFPSLIRTTTTVPVPPLPSLPVETR